MASLPSQAGGEIDKRLKLEGYWIALEGCNLADLEAVVRQCIKGQPAKYQWAPIAPELAQLVRNAKARREWDPSKALKSAGADASDDGQPTDEERKRMYAKWQKVRETFGISQVPCVGKQSES